MIRSKQFPFKNLEWCINSLSNIAKDYNAFTDIQLAPYLNNQKNNSITSGDFKKKLGALNHFKLITKQDNIYTLSDEALILLFNNDHERNKTLKKIALSPESFNSFFENIKNTTQHTFSTLDAQNIAINKLGIKPNSFQVYFKNLVDTFIYAEIITKTDFDNYSLNIDLIQKIELDTPISYNSIATSHSISDDQTDQISIPFLMEDNIIRNIVIPNPKLLSNTDLKRLKQLIEMYTD